jgi:hypothetical protein
MKWLIAIAVVVGAHTADARCRICRLADELQGGAFMHYEATVLEHVDDAAHGTPVDELILVGAKLHGFVGASEDVQYHVGFDLAAGATLSRGGFAYDCALFPLGIAARFGRTSFIAFGTGVSFMGATRTLDDAVLLPLETTIEADVTKRLRVLGRFRASYAAGAPARHDGAPSIPFADELEAMAGVRIGRHYESYGFPSGNGYFLAASYRELMGTRFVGLTLGYSIDIGSPDSYKRRLRRKRGDLD